MARTKHPTPQNQDTPTPKARLRPPRINEGRPSKYTVERLTMPELAFNYCLLGATNEDLAKAFNVSISTIDKWIVDDDEFSCAITQGREEADARVSRALYSRACGYSHKATKIFYDSKLQDTVSEEFIEHYPPDTAAAIFWLKNRQRVSGRWRDKHEQEISGPNGQPLQINQTNDEKAKATLDSLIASLGPVLTDNP